MFVETKKKVDKGLKQLKVMNVNKLTLKLVEKVVSNAVSRRNHAKSQKVKSVRNELYNRSLKDINFAENLVHIIINLVNEDPEILIDSLFDNEFHEF